MTQLITDVFNIEEAQKKLNAEQKRVRDKEIDDVQKVLRKPEGRRLLWRLLSICGVFRNSFTPNSNQTAFNEGMRNIGLLILKDIHEADTSAFAQMQNEELSRQQTKKEASNA